MQKYNKDSKCSKCGSDGADSTHVPSQKIYDSFNGQTPEFIRRTCKNCGYVWREESLDS